MPNRRSEHQKAIIVMMNEEFLDAINCAYPIAGYGDRAQFIRDATYRLVEETTGVKLPPKIKAPPNRKGKGGRKKPPEKVNTKRGKKNVDE